ncbi:hypothetical protein N665_0428s0019 [Sinapis alba]|nr:hypothetical protein N665_0428s0019 [Sinapis alba]
MRVLGELLCQQSSNCILWQHVLVTSIPILLSFGERCLGVWSYDVHIMILHTFALLNCLTSWSKLRIKE